MTFNQAYNLAIERSNEFKKHDAKVKESMENRTDSGCLLFSIEGESFYYGFDGVDLHKGKHTARRSQYLIDCNMVLIIL